MRTKKEILDNLKTGETEFEILSILIDIRDVLAGRHPNPVGGTMQCVKCGTPTDNQGNCCNGACN